MDEQSMMNQEQAVMMGRTAFMAQDNPMNTLLLEKLDTERLLQKTELSLQGLDSDENGKTQQVCRPLLNREGAMNMRRYQEAQVNNVTQMSNFEEEQSRVLTEELALDVATDLLFSKKRYNIDNTHTDLTAIRTIVCDPAFSCNMAAMDNGIKQMLRKTTIESSINVQGQSPKGKGGGVMSMLGMGRKN
jgi:hypothetical protein